MQTKLTLRLDDELIKKAKLIAKKRNKSLSKLVSEYFTIMTAEGNLKQEDLTPKVKVLYGALADQNVDKSDYLKYLEKKHS